MKKLILLVMSCAIIQADEKPSFVQPVYDAAIEQIISKPNLAIEEAIADFYDQLGMVNLTKADIKQFVVTIANTLNKKFPGQAVRIAKLLNSPYANEWLKSTVNYQSRQTTAADVDRAVAFIVEDKLVSLQSWLAAGYDPNVPSTTGGNLLFSALENANLGAVKALVGYGVDLKKSSIVFMPGFMGGYLVEGTPLKVIAQLPASSELKEIEDYLRVQGAQ